MAILTSRTGLAPSIGRQLRVLVLGSFPGERSLRAGAYYAHPRNRFWRAMAPACAAATDPSYEARIAALHAAGVGLWDVLHSCTRRGSLDQSIVPGSERANDLGRVVRAHPELRALLLNGASVARLFHRHQVPRALWADLGVAVHVLPSTSPAHARMSPDTVAAEWHAVLGQYLTPR